MSTDFQHGVESQQENIYGAAQISNAWIFLFYTPLFPASR